jgi:hypothetical protein
MAKQPSLHEPPRFNDPPPLSHLPVSLAAAAAAEMRKVMVSL